MQTFALSYTVLYCRAKIFGEAPRTAFGNCADSTLKIWASGQLRLHGLEYRASEMAARPKSWPSQAQEV